MIDPARLKRACEAFNRVFNHNTQRLPMIEEAIQAAIEAYNQPEEPTVDKWREFERILRQRSKTIIKGSVPETILSALAEVNRDDAGRYGGVVIPKAVADRIAQFEALLRRIAEYGYSAEASHTVYSVSKGEILSLLNTKEQAP